MDSLCKELDEVKLELVKIKDEYRIKTELIKSLRKANDDQVVKYQEVKFQMEKLVQELSAKEEEMAEMKHLHEDMKHRLQGTESSLKHASSVSEKLRIDCGEKLQRLEGENEKLVLALNAATSNNSELERQLCACREEVAGLKVLVSDSQKKCLEAEQKFELKKALSNRDDAIMKLEEESVHIQDRLKWKTEQFDHLKEAHKLLQEQFQSNKQEWASEKTGLLQEISSLQISLDTQIRMNENLQSELKMCNQALAHEESRRKASEIQLSETKLCFENVLGEFDEAKSKIENMRKERDEEVAALRITLGTKNSNIKEMEYSISHLEQENKELLHSVKELQEAQIGKKKPDATFIKLRNKLRELEQTHSRCSTILEDKEAEWNMKMERMIGHVTRFEFDLLTKSEEISQLKKHVETCQSSIAISGEEISILVMVLKSEFSEVYSKMLDLKSRSDTVSAKQELAGESQLKAQLQFEQASEEIASLSKKLEALKTVEGKNTLLEYELEKCRKMLEESSIRQLRLEEHAALMEASAKEMRDATVDLHNEKAQLEQEWKRKVLLARSDAEKFKQEMEKLCVIAAGKDQSTRDLQNLEQNFLDATVSSFAETFEMLVKNGALTEALENAEYLSTTEVQKKKSILEQNFLDATVSSFAETFEMLIKNGALTEALENAAYLNTTEVQEKKSLLEQNFLDATVSSFAETFEMLIKNGALREALENAECMLTTEVEEKKKLVSAMEKESIDVCAKIVHTEESLLRSQNRTKEIEALLDHKTLEMVILKDDLGNMQGKYMKAEKEVQEKTSLVSALENEFTDLRAKNVHVEESLLNLQTRAEELKALLEHKTLEMDNLKDDLGNVKGNHKKVEKESADLHAKIVHIEELLVNSQNRAIELQDLLDHKTLEMDSLKGYLENVESKYKTAKKEVQEKKNESAALQAEIVHIKESLICSQNRVKELEVLLEDKTLEMDSLTDNLGNVEGKYKMVEKEVQEKKCLISALEDKSADLQAKIVQVEESLLYSQDKVKELEALLDHKTLEMDSLKDNLENTEVKFKKMENEVQETKSLVSALEKESADLRAKNLHVEGSLLSSENRAKELEVLLDHNSLVLDNLKDDLKNAQSEYKKVEKELKLTKQALAEDNRKSSHEKESLIACIKEDSERVEGFCVDDAKLMGMLDKMLGHCEENELKQTESIVAGNKVDLKGNLNRRAYPLKELNQ